MGAAVGVPPYRGSIIGHCARRARTAPAQVLAGAVTPVTAADDILAALDG